ncbi:MAG: tRNA (adenosine(37)-N6)-dimethylallyltransferase MiaA [Burkholderiaceae bacterium]
MVYCLIGPTASGKSALAMALAQSGSLGAVEIVSLDSAQVYRYMDIGTAKPSAAEQKALPHHLIDCRDPEDAYSVAQYLQDARAAIAAIEGRGGKPLLVGGTMLYFNALRQGIDDLPAVPVHYRKTLAQEAAERGWPALHGDLQQVDPHTAQRLAPTDAQRISRALEVWRHTGRPISAFHSRGLSAAEAADQGDAARKPQGFSAMPLRVIALQPEDRTWLHRRIADRFDQMLQQGFLQEVAALRERPHLVAEMPSVRTVGYRQAWAHLAGQTDFATFCQQALAATRQLAKRQITWLRSFQEIDRIDPSASASPAGLTLAQQLARAEALWGRH